MEPTLASVLVSMYSSCTVTKQAHSIEETTYDSMPRYKEWATTHICITCTRSIQRRCLDTGMLRHMQMPMDGIRLNTNTVMMLIVILTNKIRVMVHRVVKKVQEVKLYRKRQGLKQSTRTKSTMKVQIYTRKQRKDDHERKGVLTCHMGCFLVHNTNRNKQI